jgi:type 1 fimbriae regulatory protein FimE
MVSDGKAVNGLEASADTAPCAVSGNVRPKRKHLTEEEVAKLRLAARRSGSYGQRDETLIMVMAAHGLRCSEAIDLRWDDIDLDGRGSTIYVRRRKRGKPSTQQLCGPEVRMLRRLRHDWPDNGGFVFVSERKGPMTDSNVRKLIARLGREAGLRFPVHPHMLRHAAGYRLVNQPGVNLRQIQDFLGHRNVSNTTWYTELSTEPFKNIEPAFRD